VGIKKIRLAKLEPPNFVNKSDLTSSPGPLTVGTHRIILIIIISPYNHANQMSVYYAVTSDAVQVIDLGTSETCPRPVFGQQQIHQVPQGSFRVRYRSELPHRQVLLAPRRRQDLRAVSLSSPIMVEGTWGREPKPFWFTFSAPYSTSKGTEDDESGSTSWYCECGMGKGAWQYINKK
jgi:hypothetical protein